MSDSDIFTIPARRCKRCGGLLTSNQAFFFTDEDKARYCQIRGVAHSDLYEKYGFVRTGCACCPFGSRFEDELQTAERLDPGLRLAAANIFGPAYEYTRAYRRYKIQHDEMGKRIPGQLNLWDEKEDKTWANATVGGPTLSASSMSGQPASVG